MIKVFLDTNVVLDIALARPLFCEEASEIFIKINENKILGYVSATSVTDIFYVLNRANGCYYNQKYQRFSKNEENQSINPKRIYCGRRLIFI